MVLSAVCLVTSLPLAAWRLGRVYAGKMSTLCRVAVGRSMTIWWSYWSWSTPVRLPRPPGSLLSSLAFHMPGKTRRTRWGWEISVYLLLSCHLPSSIMTRSLQPFPSAANQSSILHFFICFFFLCCICCHPLPDIYFPSNILILLHERNALSNLWI